MRRAARSRRSAELYDPSAGTFAFLGDTITGHFKGTATLLMNGKVLIAGGSPGDIPSDNAELDDPAIGKFAATGNLTARRERHAAILMPDGTVLFAGGHGNIIVNPDNLAGAEIYDPVTGAFHAVGSMLTGRDILGATLLSNGRVLITGGSTIQSAISCNRVLGSFSKQLFSRRCALAGTRCPSGSLVRTQASVSEIVSPWKSRRPVSISYSTTPNAQISAG